MQNKPISPKTHGRISVTFMWLGAIITLLTNNLSRWFLWVGLALVVSSIVYRYIAVRCPCCRKNLAGYQTVPDRCPNCGETLN